MDLKNIDWKAKLIVVAVFLGIFATLVGIYSNVSLDKYMQNKFCISSDYDFDFYLRDNKSFTSPAKIHYDGTTRRAYIVSNGYSGNISIDTIPLCVFTNSTCLVNYSGLKDFDVLKK